jgi:hypothetical protein
MAPALFALIILEIGLIFAQASLAHDLCFLPLLG